MPIQGSQGNLKKLREKAGLTQAQLAKLCDVRQQTISMIEAGKNEPSLSLLESLRKHLKVSYDELLK